MGKIKREDYMPFIKKENKLIWVNEYDYLMSKTKEELIEMIETLKAESEMYNNE